MIGAHVREIVGEYQLISRMQTRMQHLVSQYISQQVSRGNFGFANQLDNLHAAITYELCEELIAEHIVVEGIAGIGTNRLVLNSHSDSGKTVLKLAYTKDGEQQNLQELDIWTLAKQYQDESVLAEVFNASATGQWLEMERCQIIDHLEQHNLHDIRARLLSDEITPEFRAELLRQYAFDLDYNINEAEFGYNRKGKVVYTDYGH